MKKCLILTLLILLTLSSVCFADSFEIGLTGGKDLLRGFDSLGGGLHLGWTNYFGLGMVGIGVFGNIGYHTFMDKESSEKFDTVRATILIGPIFNFINGRFFSLPISTGLFIGSHAWTSFSHYSDFSMILGVGLNITPQFDMGETMRFFLRPQAALNFYDVNTPHAIFNISLGISFNLSSNAKPRASLAANASLNTPGEYFISHNGKTLGPFNMGRLKFIEEMGIFTRETLVWKNGMNEWAAAGNQEDLIPLFNSMPPPLP